MGPQPHETDRGLIAPFVALFIALAGCAEPPAATSRPRAVPPPAAEAAEGFARAESNAGGYVVLYRADPEPIPLNEPFALEVRVLDADTGAPAHGVELLIDGRMPDHRHGMIREPAVTDLGEGRFEVAGMLFHMPGYWELHFDIERGGRVERAQASVTLE